MQLILSTTFPIYALILIGYSATRTNLFPKEFLTGIGRFVLYFAMPAIIFKTISGTNIKESIDPYFISAYGIGSLLSFILMFTFFKIFFKNKITESGLKGLGSAMPNSIYVGFPLLIQAMDSPPFTAFAMALLVENIIIFPLALIVMDIGANKGSEKSILHTLSKVVSSLVKNPILIALTAGLIASLAELTLPGPVDKVVTLLAQASTAVALFFIGGLLVGTSIRGSVRSIAAVSIGKLIIHPALVAGCIFLMPDFDPELKTAAILLAASPMFAIYPIIGARYNYGAISASILLVTTTASFATISVILWILTL